MNIELVKKTLVFAIVLLFVGLIIAPNISSENNTGRINNSSARTVAFNPFEEGWKYRKKITINHNKVTRNLFNFPVLVSTIDTDLHDKAQIDGGDILFMDDKGEANQLFHEIEYYDSISSELVAWVNIPALSSTEDVVFYMYYGNIDCGNQEIPEMVWDLDYIHVWHLGDNLLDSAGSDDGTNHGTDIVSGKIGRARDFEHDDQDFIYLGDMVQPGDGSLTTITWECWVKPESQDIKLMTKYDTSGADYASYHMDFRENGKLDIWVASAWGVTTHGITDNSYAVIGEWIYLTATFNLGGVNDLNAFINGWEVAFTQSTSSAKVMKDIPISDDIGRGRYETWTDYADGIFDEIRWSKVVRSDDWIITSYNSMNDPSSFLSFGDEEKPRQKAYNNIFFQWFLECFPLLEKLLSLFR